jgi:ubiquinol-cytochrome c reductase iron-sulfur subunit
LSFRCIRLQGRWAAHIPDPATRADPTNRAFTYFVQGGGKFLYASVARVAVLKALSLWSPAADVMALASLEVDISKIAEGTSATVMWRGKPVFIRHRTKREIDMALADDKAELRDPQPDSARVQKQQWLIVMGICTHFGCVPLNGLGDYSGWFCPCHGSHYDTSGRIRRGPAPLNLEVPEYSFMSEDKVLLGN